MRLYLITPVQIIFQNVSFSRPLILILFTFADHIKQAVPRYHISRSDSFIEWVFIGFQRLKTLKNVLVKVSIRSLTYESASKILFHF